MNAAENNLVQALSSHGRREQKRKDREDAQLEKDEITTASEKRSQYVWLFVTLLCLVALAVGLGYLLQHKPQLYIDHEVHWHALVDISICGQHRDLPRANSGELVHDQPYRGIPLMHAHDDNVIHIEGLIQKKEDILLGRFFDAIDVSFDKDRIMDVKNGDLCDGKPGVLKMFVNDQPRKDFRDYVPFAESDAHKQVIKLVFAPES